MDYNLLLQLKDRANKVKTDLRRRWRQALMTALISNMRITQPQ